ncbi:MAG: sodium:solute symporter family protein [Saprospiraceae bacterium]|nr:sodium:solute symporter family protein [Saprospiraceae bacterium]
MIHHPIKSTVALLAILFIVGVVIDMIGGSIFWPGFISLMIFYALIFLVALRSARQTARDHMLASRSLPLWLGIFTMSATWVGGGFINGTAEYTYSEGLIWVQAPWGYALSLIVGGLIFAKPMRSRNFTTMLDPLEARFGRYSNFVFFIPALLGDLFWISAILVALGTTFGTILGIDFATSIIISGFIVILYTAIGGLWSVATTDVVQLMILWIGLLLVVVTLLDDWSGLQMLFANYRDDFGEKVLPWPTHGVLGSSTAIWWDSALLLIFGGIPWQVYFQRVLAARDSTTAVRLSILAGVVCFLAALPPVVIGIIAYGTDWVGLGLPPPADPAFVLPHVIKYLCDPVVATIGLGAIAAAVMSSADSSILASSSILNWNLFPKVDEATKDKSRLQKMIWIVGVTAMLIALKVGSIYELWFLCSDLVYCLLFPALVTALFDRRSNGVGALAGFAVALFIRSGGGEPFLGLPAWLPFPSDGLVITVPYKTIAMLSGLITIMLVSRVFPRYTIA